MFFILFSQKLFYYKYCYLFLFKIFQICILYKIFICILKFLLFYFSFFFFCYLEFLCFFFFLVLILVLNFLIGGVIVIIGVLIFFFLLIVGIFGVVILIKLYCIVLRINKLIYNKKYYIKLDKIIIIRCFFELLWCFL